MQKFVIKYGLAAHLALLAVAPLFLLPSWCLWLSLFAATWVLVGPSKLGKEYLHDAQKRVAHAIVTDPLFWFSLVVVALAACRWLNGGIAFKYDAETTRWVLSEAAIPFLPGSVAAAGYSEFSAAIALAVVLQGCRHALGRSARLAFCLTAVLLVGTAAVGLLFLMSSGVEAGLRAAACAVTMPSYWGSVFGLFLVLGVIAIFAVFERKWYGFVLPLMAAVAGCACGLFVFAPAFVQLMYAPAALLLFLYAFIRARKVLPGVGEFRFLVVFALALALGFGLVMWLMPEAAVQERSAPYVSRVFFDEASSALRKTLNALSLDVWKVHPWLGSGLETFPLSLRFVATDADWLTIAPEQATPLNGYWLLLAERGILGATTVAVTLGFLLTTYALRLFGGFRKGAPHPLCWVGPLVLAAALAEAVFDVSCSRPGFALVVAALLAVSAGAFSKEEKNG